MRNGGRRLGLIAALPIALMACSASAQDTPKTGLIVDLSKFVGGETCVSKGGRKTDIAHARFYRDDIIAIGSGDGLLYYSIERETVRISKDKKFEEFLFIPIKSLIRDGYELDLSLSFVEIDHIEYLYWKETFLHRSYRSGLFSLSGEDISPVCEGRGGIDSSH